MKARKGHVCLVDRIPQCDFCDDPGPYDFKTRFGPWAHGCQAHYRLHRMFPNTGVGMAQIWITEETEEPSVA